MMMMMMMREMRISPSLMTVKRDNRRRRFLISTLTDYLYILFTNIIDPLLDVISKSCLQFVIIKVNFLHANRHFCCLFRLFLTVDVFQSCLHT